MALEKMLLFALLALTAVRDVRPQPMSCVEDVHCASGFFCGERTFICHECLRCETLGRSPSPAQNACIKSVVQCGPCLQGLINDANWHGLCMKPNTRSWKLMSAYAWILATCVALAALLFIVHGIWNMHMNVDIDMFLFTKPKPQIELTV